MNLPASPALLTLSLGSLLAVGGVTGYFLGQRHSSPTIAVNDSIGTLPGTSPGTWADQAFSRLSSELHLSPLQSQSLRPILDNAADKVFLERDRALLQMHLRLLEVHDSLARDADLSNSQKKRLLDSRDKLKASILSRFATILRADEVSLPEL